ncbi:LSM domain containing protein [Nitzschia inconspicua]|uniref:LSM domain containing protein n=1 Tax=Nitzschia inconspicua TaxID=303405 RepID=A0A9K3LZZ8_9STRA|nr:LSM domain containing protein [Nitzschia inconspicua]
MQSNSNAAAAPATNALIHQTRRIPVSLGKASLRIRLEAYYSLIAPETLTNRSEWLGKFDQIYEKYGGTHQGERKLSSKLAKKYGTHVRLLLAKSAESQQSSRGKEAQDGLRNEEWYQIAEGQRDSGELNALSRNFDPIAMLRAPDDAVYAVNLWMNAGGMILDNVDKFASYLPLDDPQHRQIRDAKIKLTTATTHSIGNVEKGGGKTKMVHPFDAIANVLDSGPISVLHRLRKKRTTVVVRYVNAIRGTLTGTLIAFDKHMNMILRDVKETYSPRPIDNDGEKSNLELELERRNQMGNRGTTNTTDETGTGKLPATGSAGNTKTREMRQLLVRGDMVVSVYEAIS